MFTKGEKIIHNINTEARTPDGVELHAGSIHHASEMALKVGGSFTAKDVSMLLKWCANIALGADGRKAVSELTAEYEDRIEELEDKIAELEDRAEEMSHVPEVVKDAVNDLFARVTEKQLGYQETWELAKYIENYGLNVDCTGFPIAI